MAYGSAVSGLVLNSKTACLLCMMQIRNGEIKIYILKEKIIAIILL